MARRAAAEVPVAQAGLASTGFAARPSPLMHVDGSNLPSTAPRAPSQRLNAVCVKLLASTRPEAAMMPEEDRSIPGDAETDEPCDPVMTQVRCRIAAGRQALGLEPELLDAICGFREGTLARLEAGQSRIGPAHLFRLANVFDVGVDWFFTSTEPLPPPLTSDRFIGALCVETRRFLALYARLGNRKLRDEIRLLVSAIAQHACGEAGTGLPLAPTEHSPDP
jgi:transcriptional regulator with XRE-family HTH domain